MNINDITIVIPTSVIPDHPSTEIIDATIKSVRYHFPNNEIILQIDGIRQEQQHRKENYNEYKSRLLWKCLHEYSNVLPVIFNKHSHQTTMMKETISLIRTPLLFYIESDLPLRTDREIPWQDMMDMLDDPDKANTIRLYLNESIPSEHQYLMHEPVGDFLKTSQWSQTPHISRLDYYLKQLLPFVNDCSYIEDIFYGKVMQENWENHKLWIYYPDNGKEMSRCLNLDGRKNLRKFTSDDDAWNLTET